MTLLELDWTPLWLTFRLAALTTAILLVIGLPLAAWLARTTSPLRPLAETLVSMPLVLPPSVLGFYLLLAFSPQSWLGRWLIDTFNLKLVFTFEGLVLGSVLFSLPFMVQPLQSALANLPPSLREAAAIEGASRWAFFSATLASRSAMRWWASCTLARWSSARLAASGAWAALSARLPERISSPMMIKLNCMGGLSNTMPV